jgi:DNA polymerase-3 subunit gamma/tau
MIKGWAYRPARHGRRGTSRKTGGGGGPAGASTGGAGMPAGAMTGGAGMPAGSGAATGAGAACCGALGAAGAAMAGAGKAMPAKAGAKAGGGGPKRGTAPGKAPSGSRLASLCCTNPAAKASRVATSGISGRGGTVPRLGKGTPAPGGAGRPSLAGPQARSQNFATAWPGSVEQPASISASSAQSCA